VGSEQRPHQKTQSIQRKTLDSDLLAPNVGPSKCSTKEAKKEKRLVLFRTYDGGSDGKLYDVILLDPPYSYRKSMELYNGHKNSRFKQLLDVLPDILTPPGWVITFGYHSRVMSASRGFRIREICLISHGGAQHDTVATVEERIQVTRGETKDEQ
jgi:hypothetical protein